MRVRMKWFDQQSGRSPRLRGPLSLRSLRLWAGGLLVLGLALWGCSKKTITAPDANSPMIASFTATPKVVGRGETSLLFCSAQDPDGDSLSYSWSTTTGMFLSVGGDSAVKGYARWKAPDTAASATVTVTASDNRGKNAQKLTAITVTVYRLVISWGSQGSGAGQFLNPVGIAVGPTGEVYVADAGNNRIQKFNSNGAYLRQWIRGDGDNDTTHHDLKNPRGVAVDRLNNVYVVDTGNKQVQWFADNGSVIQYRGYYGKPSDMFGTLNGAATIRNLDFYVSGNDSLGNGKVWLCHPNDSTSASHWGLSSPGLVAADNNEHVYVPATQGNKLVIFVGSSGFIEFGTPGDSSGQFNGPFGVAVDDSTLSNVYITDAGNHRVQKFRIDYVNGTITYRTQFGSLGAAPNQFNGPMGIALGADYSVYVVDAGNYQVKKFSAK
jgi:DNA-binding beta-propeller fold protein YncE